MKKSEIRLKSENLRPCLSLIDTRGYSVHGQPRFTHKDVQTTGLTGTRGYGADIQLFTAGSAAQFKVKTVDSEFP